MRSAIIILASFGLLLLGFGIYWLLQPPVEPGRERIAAAPLTATPLQRGEHTGIIGAGAGAWVNQYDDRGQPLSRFRAARFDPRQDGTVYVSAPQAEFFLSGGQILRIVGDDGDITVPETGLQSGVIPAGQMPAPTRGELRNVRIALFQGTDLLDAQQPALTIDVANAAFDNDTFQIRTESYTTAEGSAVARDQVPVRIRSEEFHFDGRGLIIRWNERDQRLEYVEVTHGERLEVLNPRMLSRMQEATPTPQPPHADEPAPASTPGLARQPAAPADAQAVSRPYRATLNDAVLIRQGDQELASADVLHISFALDRVPDDRRTAGPVQPPPEATPPAAPPADAALPPADPQEPPLHIHWEGKLTLVPEPDMEMIVPPGEAIVQLHGAPLRLQQDQTQVLAHTLRYSSADGQLALAGAEQQPVVLTDARGARIETPAMDWLHATRQAVLHGRSHAVIPVDEDRDVEGATIRADWAERCIVLFADIGRQLVVAEAVLEGEVRVVHPQLDLASDRLAMVFDPQADPSGAGARVALRRIDAEGDATCVLIDQQGQEQTVKAQALQVATAVAEDGRPYPQIVTASGDVHMFDAQQDLRAGAVKVTLAPAPQAVNDRRREGAVDLLELHATQEVRYSTHDGAQATADALAIHMRSGHPEIRLTGEPASIVDGDNALSGPDIRIMPDTRNAAVNGPGRLVAMHRDDAADAARPIEVAWQRAALVAAEENRVDVTGEVLLRTVDAEGAISEARANSVHITLADVAPADEAPASPAAAPAPGSPAPREMNLMRDKAVAAIVMRESVQFSSTLSNDHGQVLRGLNLWAERAEYDAAGQRLIVPVPGRALYQDHRPDEQEQRAAADDRRVSQRGATAFEWQEELVYRQAEQVVAMSGEVVVVHQGDGEQPGAFRLEAPVVQAELETAADPAADTDAEPLQRGQIRRLVAEGGLRFTAAQLQFDAASIEYLPVDNLVVARGSQHHPATLYDEQGFSRGSFEELRYNLATEHLRVIGPAGDVRPR